MFVDDSGEVWLMTSHKIIDEAYDTHNEICLYGLVFLNSELGEYIDTMDFYENLDDIATILETIDQETGLTLLCQQR